jgi:hypothetical protein
MSEKPPENKIINLAQKRAERMVSARETEENIIRGLVQKFANLTHAELLDTVEDAFRGTTYATIFSLDDAEQSLKDAVTTYTATLKEEGRDQKALGSILLGFGDEPDRAHLIYLHAVAKRYQELAQSEGA